MHPTHRRNRLPRRNRRRRLDTPAVSVAGADIVIVGFFSAREPDYVTRMDDAANVVATLGGQVVAMFTQRRGVSAGGVGVMARPLSPRTLFSTGKVGEIAAACAELAADAVVVINELTPHQRSVLTKAFGRSTISLAEL
ncbi:MULTISPECIES: hypothetical protein [unclassified Nocardia]|uniref:HflX-like GTP-binding protein n=1 Tax=unclassified Nocardia TaxID=2637762 RepID=UPI0034166CC0